MLSLKDIPTLTSRPERADNRVLTVYLDVDQSKQANMNHGFENHLKNMLAGIKAKIQDEREMRAFQHASSRMTEMVAQYNVGARGLVAVFDASDGFLWSGEVDFPLISTVRWDRAVSLQMLAAAFDEHERAGVVLLDRARLRLFSIHLGEIEEHLQEEFDRKKVRHTKSIGSDHIGSANHAQHRADEAFRLNLRHIAKDVDALVSNGGIERLILAGAPDTTAELQHHLPKRNASRVIGRIDLPISATPEEVQKAALALSQKHERESEEAVVADLVTTAAKTGQAVIGLADTLYAVNHRRVWRLVYADSFRSAGFECLRCAALFSIEPDTCPFCESAVRPVDDVVERAVSQVMRKGSRIEVVRSPEAESNLTNAGGVGAFLRTRTSVRAS